MRILAATILTVFLSGCGGVYDHPDPYRNNPTAFEQDQWRCQQQASSYAASWGAQGNPFLMAEAMDKCLRMEYGWIRR